MEQAWTSSSLRIGRILLFCITAGLLLLDVGHVEETVEKAQAIQSTRRKENGLSKGQFFPVVW